MKLNFKNGTTLVELVVVLSILIIVLGISFSLFDATDHELVREQAYALAEYIFMTQQRAHLAQKDLYIVCDEKNSSYTDETGTYFLTQCMFGAPAQAKGPPSAPHAVIKKPITFEKSQIKCYANGTVKSGTLYVCNLSKTVFFAVTTPIDEVTNIRIYEYQTNSWHLLS